MQVAQEPTEKKSAWQCLFSSCGQHLEINNNWRRTFRKHYYSHDHLRKTHPLLCSRLTVKEMSEGATKENKKITCKTKLHQIMREITKEEAPELRNELLRFKKEVFDPLEESIKKLAREKKDATNRRRQAKARALKQRQQQQEDETSSSGQGCSHLRLQDRPGQSGGDDLFEIFGTTAHNSISDQLWNVAGMQAQLLHPSAPDQQCGNDLLGTPAHASHISISDQPGNVAGSMDTQLLQTAVKAFKDVFMGAFNKRKFEEVVNPKSSPADGMVVEEKLNASPCTMVEMRSVGTRTRNDRSKRQRVFRSAPVLLPAENGRDGLRLASAPADFNSSGKLADSSQISQLAILKPINARMPFSMFKVCPEMDAQVLVQTSVESQIDNVQANVVFAQRCHKVKFTKPRSPERSFILQVGQVPDFVKDIRYAFEQPGKISKSIEVGYSVLLYNGKNLLGEEKVIVYSGNSSSKMSASFELCAPSHSHLAAPESVSPVTGSFPHEAVSAATPQVAKDEIIAQLKTQVHALQSQLAATRTMHESQMAALRASQAVQTATTLSRARAGTFSPVIHGRGAGGGGHSIHKETMKERKQKEKRWAEMEEDTSIFGNRTMGNNDTSGEGETDDYGRPMGFSTGHDVKACRASPSSLPSETMLTCEGGSGNGGGELGGGIGGGHEDGGGRDDHAPGPKGSIL